MSRNLVNNTTYHKKAYMGIGLIAIAAVIICLVLSALFILPNLAIYQEPAEQRTIVSLVPENDGLIGVGADTSLVYVTVQYSDGTTESIALSEFIYSGLDVSTEHDELSVVLNYGGFEQEVSYSVLSTMKTLKYVASTGGRIEGDDTQYIFSGGDASTVIAIADEGYEFVRWSDGNPNAMRTDTSISSDLELTATFQKQTFTVVFFYPDGTTAREEIVSYGEAATTDPNPDMDADMAKYGYVFTGWSQSFDSITANTNIYPLYEKYATDVTLLYTQDIEGNDLGSATGLMSYYPKEELAIIKVTANYGKVFVGWSILTQDGTYIELSATGASATLEIEDLLNYVVFTTSGSDTTEEYSLSFTPTAETDELTIIANFEYTESTISFYSMGSRVYQDITVSRGQAIGDVLSASNYTLEAGNTTYNSLVSDISGYTFVGWYDDSADLDASGNVVILSDAQTFSAPTTLVAYWEKNTYIVTFTYIYTDQSGVIADIPVEVYYQDPISNAISNAFPTYTPTLTNYTFVGWYLMEDGMLTDTVVNRNYKINGNITVGAKFEVNKTTTTANITGSGAVYVKSTSDNSWSSLTGSYEMAVTGSYQINFAASTGYTIDSITYTTSTNANEIAVAGVSGLASYTIDIDPSVSYVYTVTYKQALNSVTITNGDIGEQGDIEYVSGETSDVVSSATIIIDVEYGSSMTLWISAPYGYYLSKVTIGTTEQSIPANSTKLTVLIENVTSAQTVKIEYIEQLYSSELVLDDEALSSGSVTQISGSDSNNSYGSEVSYLVEANSGYYIKSLVINGYYVDPYALHSGVSISDIAINYESVLTGLQNAEGTTSTNDYRITSYIFTIEGIGQDTVIEIVYGEIYYTITASVEGSGWTNFTTATVLRGGTSTITATCYDGNYISSYSINGEVTNKTSADSSTAINLTNVTADTVVIFTTETIKHNISYQNTDGGATLTYDNGEGEIAAGENANLAEASNTTFVIEANYGKYITSVYIDGVSMTDLAYSATYYTFDINGLDGTHNIIVTTSNIEYDVLVYLGNAGTSTMTVMGSGSSSATVSHGNALTIIITAENGKSVDLNTITYSSTGGYTTTLDTSGVVYTISITPVSSDMVIFIPLSDYTTDSSKTIFDVAFTGETNGTLEFISNDDTSNDSTMQVNKDGNFSVKAVAESGYELKYLVVNGVSVSFTDEGAGVYTYTINNVSNDVTVDAVFGVITYNLILTTVGNGTATTASATYNYEGTISIRINSASGYTLESISISVNGEAFTKITNVSSLYNANTGEYDIGSVYTANALAIEVTFIADKFDITIAGNEGGTIEGTYETISYGEEVQLLLAAESGYFIDVIEVNGVNIDPSTLGGNPQIDVTVQEYTAGTLIFTATQETYVEITFKANVYLVTVTDAVNGTVGVRESVNSSSSTNNSTELSTSLYLNNNSNMDIVIVSEEGYHVSEILINGVAISGWEIDSSAGAENVNNNFTFEYEGVSENLTIKVTFSINEYDIVLTTVNNSVNFSDYDYEASSYGSLGIYGYSVDGGFIYDATSDVSNGTIYGVEYGSSIIFTISPINSKGYYVSSFTIQWSDPNDESGETQTQDFTVTAREYGQVVFTLEHEIISVTAEFSKYTYTVDERYITDSAGSSYYADDSSIVVTFANPYDSTVAVKTVNGTEYEYGITYTVTSIAGVGYTRTALYINDADRNASVRSDMYTSTITEDLVIIANYDINVYTIGITSNIYSGAIAMGSFIIQSDRNENVWIANSSSGSSVSSGEYESNSGVIYVSNGVLSVTHGTLLYFVATPDSENGYMLSTIRVNNASQTITNEDETSTISMYIEAATSYAVNMLLHTYDVNYVLSVVSNGAKVTLSSTVVDWGTNATLSIDVYSGYYIAGVSINGTSSAEALNALKAQAQYTVLSIKADTTITIIMACNDVDIQFSGMYNTNVATNEADGDDNSVVVAIESKTTGAVFEHSSDSSTTYTIASSGLITGANEGGAKYSDKITIYFYPVVGYEMESVSIYMYNQNGNLQSSVVSVASLTYDSSTNCYYYIIDPLVGKVVINVTYAVRTYSISVNAVGSGAIGLGTDTKTVNHYELLELYMNAYYGYHLSSLKINDISIDINNYTYELNESGDKVYSYTATDYVLNDILNNKTTLYVEAVYTINEYSVIFYVNGTIGSDESVNSSATLTPSIVDNSIQYSIGSSSYVTQVTSEGYSITSIIFYNSTATTENVVSISTYNTEYYYATSLLSFKVTGEVMDMLDYHDTGKTDTLYIYYTTALDTHISYVETYLSEEGRETNPEDSEFGLVSTYDTAAYSDGRYEYFTIATLSLTLTSAQSANYYFAGFQEYNSITNEWVYVTNGVDGITLNSSGTILTYEIKADREFRAVVFRQYTVTIEVHPEYKYISGTNANSTVDMVYRQYASLTAKVTYNDLQPNIESNIVEVTDTDGDSTNGVYVYKILNGATLSLTYLDSITSTNKTSSISYYDSDLSVSRTTSLNYASGVTILEDTNLHAYFNNTIKVTFFTETEGATTASDGATITYTLNGKTTTPSSGVITTTANSTIQVTIVPKANYAFVALSTLEESINSPDSSGNKVWTGNWIEVVSTGDGYTTVEYTYLNGEITKVVMTIVVTENMVYNMSFIKMVYVSSDVYVLSDNYNADSGILVLPTLASDTSGSQAVSDVYVEYNTQLSYTILIPEESYNPNNTLAVEYQFMGFSANGVLNHTNIGATYPTLTSVTIDGKLYYSYSVTYTIADYDASSQKDGVIIGEDNGQFEVIIYAYISPVYNIIVENVYEYDFGNEDMDNIFFDTGLLTATTSNGYYDIGKMSYNTSTKYIESTTANADNSIIVQMLDQQNDGRTYSTDASSDYNSWSSMEITLNWASSTISSMQSMYSFIAWQYWGYDSNGDLGWHNIPYSYNNGLVDATSSSYTFPISVLFDYTYMSYGTYTDSTYSSGDLNIDVIKIRPAFQRQIEVEIDRVVYYTAYGVDDESHKNDNPASLSNSGDTSGTFKYYDDVITMTPETQTGYEFLGWYYKDVTTGEFIQITSTDTSSNMYLVGEKLILYVTEDIYDPQYNTITIYPRFIKTWNITFQVSNLSGSSSLMGSSIPVIVTGDVSDNGGSYTIDTTTLVNVGLTLYTVTIYAGTQVGFMLATTSNFSEENDTFAYTTTTVDGVTYIWTGDSYSTLPLLESSNMDKLNSSEPTMENGDIQSSYIIFGNADKKITVNYETTATLTVTNFYYGATLVLNSDLAKVLGVTAIVDGEDNDDDGIKNGVIVITGIPIVSGVSYNGGYGCQLFGIANIIPITTTDFQINLDGDSITSKSQSFKYFNSTGANDGVTSINVPFANGLTSSAGDGTESNPYQISNQEELVMLNSIYIANGYSLAGIYFKMIASFSLANSIGNLCSDGNGFDGVFDGGNYTISNIYFNTGTNYIGLFSKIFQGTVTNLTLSQITISRTTASYIGGLAGMATNAVITNITISDASTIAISAASYAGALIGYVTGNSTLISDITIQKASVVGTSYIGGAIGSIEIDNSNTGEYTISNVSVANPVVSVSSERGGGVIGAVIGDTITGYNITANAPSVTNSGKYLGGVIGYNAGTMYGLVVTGTVTITSKINSTYQTFYTSYEYNYGGGGIVGYNALTGKLYQPTLYSTSTTYIYMNGSASGGIVGMNAGYVYQSNTTNYTIYVIRSVTSSSSEGGAYAAHVAYNLSTGVVEGAITAKSLGTYSASSFDNSVLVVRSTVSSSFSTAESGSANYIAAQSDKSCLYVGIVAGVNLAGQIKNSSITAGKIVVHRVMGVSLTSNTYIGGLVGFNTNSSSITDSDGSYGSNIRISAFYAFWADTASSPSTVNLYMGAITGNNMKPTGTVSVSSCTTYFTTVAYGSTYTGGSTGNVFSTPTSDSGYRTASLAYQINAVTGSTNSYYNASYRTPATSSLYTSSYSRWGSTGYYYSGNLRYVKISTL